MELNDRTLRDFASEIDKFTVWVNQFALKMNKFASNLNIRPHYAKVSWI